MSPGLNALQWPPHLAAGPFGKAGAARQQLELTKRTSLRHTAMGSILKGDKGERVERPSKVTSILTTSVTAKPCLSTCYLDHMC